MPVRKKIPFKSGIFFITFTCTKWIPLFDITNGYELVYNFFDKLKERKHFVNAYVIMPNHIHAILSFTHSEKSINTIISDGKRFISYDFVKRLENLNRFDILQILSETVNETDKKKGKLHEPFEPSFDWKYCYDDAIIEQKLNYIHMNPCVCNPPLADNPIEYIHSSANYYLGGSKIIYPVEHVMNMKDLNLNK